MGILSVIVAIVLFTFTARNANLALRANSKSDKIEYWVSAAVCLTITIEILFAEVFI